MQLFGRALLQQKLSHAYLLKGPSELSLSMALALAQALFCPQRGCGHCVICQSVLHHQYPDLHLIQPEGKAQIIRLQQIHHLRQQVALPPLQSSQQVFIVQEAERMNKESSNALLKTLEEPASQSVLLLLTPFLERVLPTIRSRCQIVPLFSALPSLSELQAQAEAPENLWDWSQLESTRDVHSLEQLIEHLESLSLPDLRLQLELFQRACWERIKPFIIEKSSVSGLKRAQAYLELFENAMAQLAANAHPKLIIESLAHHFFRLRQQV